MVGELLELFDAKWLIHGRTAQSYLPLLLAYINGQPIAYNKEEEDKKKVPYILAIDQNSINPVSSQDLSSPSIPDNSIAVIPINGVLCSWDTMQIAQAV